MDFGEVVAIGLAGLAAGAINTVVGSGTLITFPVLLAFGYAPVTANVSNTVGLVPGSVSGAVGYRRELEGQRRRKLFRDRGKLAGAAAPIGIGRERFEKALGRDRADQKIGRPGTHRVDGNRHRIAGRKHDDRQAWPMLAKRGD